MLWTAPFITLYCRALPWPSSWVLRRTWSARHSPRRKASTASSAPRRWPASTSCSLSRRPAPPAASPKDCSTCPASRICSPPPSRRRRPRAARSCEWRPLGLQSSHATPKPLPLWSRGRGGGHDGFIRASCWILPSPPRKPNTRQKRWTPRCPLAPEPFSAHLSFSTTVYLAFPTNNISQGLIIELSFLHL